MTIDSGDALDFVASTLICRHNGALHRALESSISHSVPLTHPPSGRKGRKGIAQSPPRAHFHHLSQENYLHCVTVTYHARSYDVDFAERFPDSHAGNTSTAITQSVCAAQTYAAAKNLVPQSKHSFVITPLSWRNKHLMDFIIADALWSISIHCSPEPQVSVVTLGDAEEIRRLYISEYTFFRANLKRQPRY